MGVWVNWGLVVAAIAFIFGDLVLEVYESVNLAVLGMFLLAGGILGLAIDSAAVGLGTASRLGARLSGDPSPPGTHAAETRFRALESDYAIVRPVLECTVLHRRQATRL